MLIKKASFKNVHGHISQDISFARDVNILIGVNGSGKTTFLNAIAWILSPESIQGGLQAAYLLSTLEFEEISITFKLAGIRKYQRVTARKTPDFVNISVRDINGILQIPVISNDPRILPPTLGRGEEVAEIIDAHLNEQRTNEVLQYLNRLPGLLYLPVDRRWPEDREPRFRRRHRSRRTVSIGSLPIHDALEYADIVLRRERRSTEVLNSQLRHRLLTSLFESLDQSSLSSHMRVSSMQELEGHRDRIVSALDDLDLPDASRAANRFFDKLEKLAARLEGHDLAKIQPQDPIYPYWVDWVVDGLPQAERVSRMVPLIEDNERRRLLATMPSRSFLESVNSFLGDSGKEVRFSDHDILAVILPNGQNTGAANLSSGELQLVILFAYLYFRFEQHEQFTILIDEPELSLHLEWQTRYLQAIKKANRHAQFIVATHSPEIAGPFEDRIIDISPPRG